MSGLRTCYSQLALYSGVTVGTMATGDGGQTQAQLMLASVQCAAQAASDAAVALLCKSRRSLGTPFPGGIRTIWPILHVLSGSGFVLQTLVTAQI